MPFRPRSLALVLCILFLTLAACAPTSPPAEDTSVPEQNGTPAAPPTLAPTPTRANAPDLTGETLEIFLFCDLSSDLAEFNNSRILAATAMADHVNDTGGIFGANLQIELVDTNGDLQVALEAYERTLRLNPAIALVVICDAESELALSEVLNRDDIPAIVPGYNSSTLYDERNGVLFATGAPIVDHFAFWLNHMSENWADLKPERAEDEIRLALISWPRELSGALDPDLAAEMAAQYGVEIVLQEELPASASANLYDVVYQARDANANAIYLSTRAYATAEILNALNALGLRQRMLVAGPDFAFESGLDDYLLAPEFAAGSYLTASVAWWDASADPFLLAQQNQDGAYLSSLAAVDIARRALEDAILEVGFEELDQAALLDALSGLEAYSVLGGLFEIDYTGGRRSPLFLQLRALTADLGQQTLIEDFAALPPVSP